MTDNAQIEMKLPPARYTIVAIAGLGEEYIVPKDPSLDDVIVMKENNRSSRALMLIFISKIAFLNSNKSGIYSIEF